MLTRRAFCGGALVLVLPACGDDDPAGSSPGREDRPTSLSGWTVPACTKLTPGRYAILAAVMDALVPEQDGIGGATVANAVFYVDQLLGAFDTDPPRVFAGGPYSGRHGGRDGFTAWQRLTRVEEIRWRTAIEGSRGIPEREFAGPVKGLVDVYAEGLDALGEAFAAMPYEDRRAALAEADPDFLAVVYAHAVEGTYGDPAYGGNADQVGWIGIDFEGDRQPLGYSAAEMAHPEDG